MNVDNGRLREINDLDMKDVLAKMVENAQENDAGIFQRLVREQGIIGQDEILVDFDDATPSQQDARQVRLHDHTSKLGKALTNERRKLRRKGKLK